MVQISNDELAKITQFVAGCNDIINGKFILADVKITKVLKMISESDELYRFITECMNGFDFLREFHRAEMKNSLNGGSFSAPQQPEKLVAFVFCLLVECDAKRIDFYNFINENFISKDRSDVYTKFANTLLVPFRDIIAGHFGLVDYSNEQFEKLEKDYRNDLLNSSPFESENDFDKGINQNVLDGADANQGAQNEQNQFFMHSTMQNNDTWAKIAEICDNVKDCIAVQKHLNGYLKDELNYIIDSIKYSVKYKDARITSALVTAFDEMSHKLRQIQFVFGELKNEIQNLYR